MLKNLLLGQCNKEEGHYKRTNADKKKKYKVIKVWTLATTKEATKKEKERGKKKVNKDTLDHPTLSIVNQCSEMQPRFLKGGEEEGQVGAVY